MMNALDALLSARALMRDVTPLLTDCGRVCGGACCRPDETGKGGMLLFPMEETLYGADSIPDGFRIFPDDSVVQGGRLLVCGGICPRELRPLACMFFPLRPTFSGRAVMDRRGFFVCPLAECGLSGLNPAFVRKAGEAAKLLCESAEQREFLRALGEGILRAAARARL